MYIMYIKVRVADNADYVLPFHNKKVGHNEKT